jgi:hypothetical protein
MSRAGINARLWTAGDPDRETISYRKPRSGWSSVQAMIVAAMRPPRVAALSRRNAR